MPKKSTKSTATAITETAAVVDSQKPASPGVSLVIMAFPGTEELMQKLWERALGDDLGNLSLLVRTADGCNLSQQAAQLLADDEVAEEFILVPANTFPTRHIERAELRIPVVYVRKDGVQEFDHRLPKLMTKELVTEILSQGVEDPETFAASVINAPGSLPLQVGMSFGNYITQVLRGDPCQNMIIEALIGKKYIAANEAGWPAVEEVAKKLFTA